MRWRADSFGSTALAALLGASSGCAPSPAEPAGEGEGCGGAIGCRTGLACVADVGVEHGLASDDDVCERPRAVYDFLHYGERGVRSRIEEALDMLAGSYRLPRMAAADPGLPVVRHELTRADGQRIDCSLPGAAAQRGCLVPDWPQLLGDAVPKYARFILFGLRITAPLVYVQQHASDAALRAGIRSRGGEPPSAAELARLRGAAGDLALALFDSFVQRGHVPFALPAMPACYAGEAGYRNPNASWAPELAQWDPTLRLQAGRLRVAEDVPSSCDSPAPITYRELRDSLWDRHATAYRALSLAGALQLFRGLLPDERREAWIRALRETGDALALPGGYEAGNNHGLSQSVALMQLAHELSLLGTPQAPPALSGAWLDLARHRLNDFVVDTVLPDGVQVEQSPFYHNYQLSLMLYVASWLRRMSIDLTAGIDPRYGAAPEGVPLEARRDFDAGPRAPTERDLNHLNPSPDLDLDGVLDAMAKATTHLVQPDGWIPMIGSSLPQQLRGYARAAFEPYLERGQSQAALELAHLWSGGEAGVAPAPADRLMVFDVSGFVTMHSGFEPPLERHTHVVFNAGMPRHRHSHADALAVHLYGPSGAAPDAALPLLVDSGWYSYREDGRHYFESTGAHNTVSLPDLNQCMKVPSGKRAGPYLPEPLLSCSELAQLVQPGTSAAADIAAGSLARGLTAWDDDLGVTWLYQSAGHALYAGVVHRRAVLLFGTAVLIVLDRLSSDEPRDFALRWHVTPEAAAPALAPEIGAGARLLRFWPREPDPAAPLFSLVQAGSAAQMNVYEGEPSRAGVPGPGWLSKAEGEMQSHPVIEFTSAGVTQAHFASVFLLGELAGQPARLELVERGAHGLYLELELPQAEIALEVDHLGRGTAERAHVSLAGSVPGFAGAERLQP